MNHFCLLPGILNTASKLSQESPEHVNPPPAPLSGRYSYLLEGLLYALEVVTHIEKPEVSL